MRQYSTTYKRIVKRGFIKNETEYYVINAILVSQGSAIAGHERTCLQRLTEQSVRIATQANESI